MSFVLGIIPARGGSKGIKNKNIIDLLGKPLIHYTINSANASNCLNDIVLSTDSEEIAECARIAGLMNWSRRPEDLASDTAKSSDVMRYEILCYEKKAGKKVDTVILLQPTAPLRNAADIDTAYKTYKQSAQSSLISGYDAQSVHPQIMYTYNGNCLMPLLQAGNEIVRRQDMANIYVRNGAVYITNRDYLMRTGRVVCNSPALYEMPRHRSINIDTLEDLDLASFYLEKMGYAYGN